MPTPPSPETFARLRGIIIDRFPELVTSRFTPAPRGWDSIAIDVDDALIFKFPRNEAARARLAREARLLAYIRPRVTVPVPDMALIETPELYSRHAKLKGEHLPPEVYARVSDAGRARLAEQLARFYAELHALDAAALRGLGAGPIGPWRSPAEIAAQALPQLPEHLRGRADTVLARYTALPPDPCGSIYGFFDGHGWNLAFDAAEEQLNGVYDFGDSGVGSLHQEFVYSSLTSFELTGRIVGAYERLAGRALDHERIDVLTAIHGLSELAEDAADPAQVEAGVARFSRWASPERR